MPGNHWVTFQALVFDENPMLGRLVDTLQSPWASTAIFLVNSRDFAFARGGILFDKSQKGKYYHNNLDNILSHLRRELS